jgi:transposase
MSNSSRYYDSTFKQRVVEHYINHHSGSSFHAVAKLFKIKGGHKTVKRWCDQYDGTIQSLEQHHRSGRPAKLTHQQVINLIIQPIKKSNQSHTVIHYPEITSNIRQNINNTISYSTVRRLGKQANIKNKKTIKRTYTESNYTYTHLLKKILFMLSTCINLRFILYVFFVCSVEKFL